MVENLSELVRKLDLQDLAETVKSLNEELKKDELKSWAKAVSIGSTVFLCIPQAILPTLLAGEAVSAGAAVLLALSQVFGKKAPKPDTEALAQEAIAKAKTIRDILHEINVKVGRTEETVIH